MSWHLPEWQFRKRVTYINGSTNYQKKIIAHSGAGTDTDTDVFLNNKAQNDFRDLRFTDFNGNPLYHYIEAVENDQAVIWVKFPPVISQNYFFLYYGNPSGENTSSGENTFIFFDDFSDGTIDSEKWETGTRGSGGSYQISEGNLELTASNNQSGSAYAINKLPVVNDIIFEYSSKATEEHYNDINIGFGSIVDVLCGSSSWWHTVLSNSYGNLIQEPTNYIYRLVNCPTSFNLQNNIQGPSMTSMTRYKIVYTAAGQWIWYYYSNGWIQLGTGQTDTTHLNAQKYIMFSRGGYSGAACGGTFSINFIFIRKYANPQPVFTWEQQEEFTLTFELQYHSLLDLVTEIKYNAYLYHETTILYDVLQGIVFEFSMLYHSLVCSTLTMYYDSLQLIDFLLELSLEDSVDAECSTGSVAIPNDKISIIRYDVANEDWVFRKKIGNKWKRQFCGICTIVRFESPPPKLVFELYDFTYFMTISYITVVHTFIEAARILRGYGIPTQILSCDLDAQNWSHSSQVTLSDSIDFKEGIGSLKAEVTGSDEWIQRMINQDFEGYGRLTFWLKSTGSTEFRVRISDGTSYVLFCLSSYGEDEWAEYYCDFNNPDVAGEIDWNMISYIQLEFNQGTYIIDDIRCETGIQDTQGNFSNGVLYEMQVSPRQIQFTGVNLTIDWNQVRKLDAAREIRDLVSEALAEPFEFFIDKFKTANFKRRNDKETTREIKEEEIISSDLYIRWR
jgi:hypothetical protein